MKTVKKSKNVSSVNDTTPIPMPNQKNVNDDKAKMIINIYIIRFRWAFSLSAFSHLSIWCDIW